MDDQPGVSDQYRVASPWPVFVALGLVIAEIGVLFAIIPLAVGGLLLFVGCIAGIVQEAGYSERPWGVLGALGVVLVVLGTALVTTQLSAASVSALSSLVTNVFGSQPNGIVVRGIAVVFAGVIAVVVSQAAKFFESDLSADLGTNR